MFAILGLVVVNPQSRMGDLFADLRQTTDVIQMGMGHDDPLDILAPEPRLLGGPQLIGPLAHQPCVDDGQVLRRGLADHVDMGVRDKVILPWNKIDPF